MNALNYILLTLVVSAIVYGYFVFAELKREIPEVPYERPDLEPLQDCPKQRPLAHCGYWKQGKQRRELLRSQRVHYEQTWLSELTQKIKEEL